MERCPFNAGDVSILPGGNRTSVVLIEVIIILERSFERFASWNQERCPKVEVPRTTCISLIQWGFPDCILIILYQKQWSSK